MSAISVALGVVLALVGVGGIIWAGWVAYRQWLALDALRSADVQTATRPLLIGGVGLLLGGFLLGLGVGRPRKVIVPSETAPPAPTA